MAINKPRGTYDILPEEARRWEKLEQVIRQICKLYNYDELRTPIFEHSEVFHRENEASDMVTKETYDFLDRANRKLTLRPEGTASIVRSYIENKLYADETVKKLFYMGPIFRYENPQKGRQRQFHQFGIEAIGSNSYLLDIEVISLGVTVIKALGLNGIKVYINTIGDEESRTNYRRILVDYFKQFEDELCADCKKRLETNPLRILDCKVDKDKDFFKNAPKINDYLNDVSKQHFNNVILGLQALNIDYEIDERLVRGLDYYSNTVFEIKVDSTYLGNQNTICGGGRYNNLVSDLGGPRKESVGLAFGLERLLLVLEAEGKKIVPDKTIHLYLIGLGDKSRLKIQSIMQTLRFAGLVCDADYNDRGLKGQFKLADKNKARFTAILGDDELSQNQINVKDNKLDTQVTINIDDLYRYIIHTMHNNQSCNGNCKSCK